MPVPFDDVGHVIDCEVEKGAAAILPIQLSRLDNTRINRALAGQVRDEWCQSESKRSL